MIYSRLPGLNKDVSRLVFGTLWLVQSEDPGALLDACRDLGCNAFDCAASYGKCAAGVLETARRGLQTSG